MWIGTHAWGECHVRAGGMVLQAKEVPEAGGQAATGPLPRAFREHVALSTPQSGPRNYETKNFCYLSHSTCHGSPRRLIRLCGTLPNITCLGGLPPSQHTALRSLGTLPTTSHSPESLSQGNVSFWETSPKTVGSKERWHLTRGRWRM